MGIWELLEIEPTSDPSVIKRAYAKKLKIYHPEDDPEGYQRLREAYDQALKHTKQTVQFQTDNYETDNHQQSSVWLETEEKVPVITVEHPVDTFFEKVEELYENFPARIQLKNWEELLSSDVLWDIQYAAAIQDEMIDFLTWHYHFPSPIWQAIDTTFRFTEKKEELEEEYGEESVRFLMDRVNGLREMRYDIFTGREEIDYDEYFQLREYIQELLMVNDLDAAEIEMEKAFQICMTDPDVLYMQAVYYARIGEVDSAIEAYGKILLLHPEDKNVLLARAQLYYSERRYMEALQELEQLLDLDAEHLEALVLRMKCRVRCLEDWGGVKEEVNHLLEKGCNTAEMQFYAYHIEKNAGASLTNKEELGAVGPIINSVFIFFYLSFHLILRAWLYIVLLIVTVVTPASSIYTVILSLLIVWEAVKLYRVYMKP